METGIFRIEDIEFGETKRVKGLVLALRGSRQSKKKLAKAA